MKLDFVIIYIYIYIISLVTLLWIVTNFSYTLSKGTLTSPCNVVGKFVSDSKKKKVGKFTWNGCPKDRYFQAIWSNYQKQPVFNGKCCGSGVDNSFSWEIRDLYLLKKGDRAVDKTWNVECESYSVITGIYDYCFWQISKCKHQNKFLLTKF